MKQKLLLVLFLFLQLANAQSPGFDIQEKELAIKKSLSTQPERAAAHIREILAYKGKLHDTVYSKANLAYGYYYMQKNQRDSSFYYYNAALSYIDTSTYPQLYAQILRNKATLYRKQSDYNEALRLLKIAGDVYELKKNMTGLAMVYGETASNYNMMLQGEKAIPFLLKAIAILEKENDTIRILAVRQSLANTYMNSGNFEFAVELYKEVLLGFKSNNILKNYAITLINYGDCLIHLKNYKEAKKALNEAIERLEKFNDSELIAVANAKVGILESELKNYSTSEVHLKNAFHAALKNNSVKAVSIAADYIALLNQRKRYTEAKKIIDAIEQHPAKKKM